MPKVLEPINFSGSRGRINATVADPSGEGPHPAVLLLHEGIGVTQHLLRVAERLSNEGYQPNVAESSSSRTAGRDCRDRFQRGWWPHREAREHGR